MHPIDPYRSYSFKGSFFLGVTIQDLQAIVVGSIGAHKGALRVAFTLNAI
jgi:hypothetical protein